MFRLWVDKISIPRHFAKIAADPLMDGAYVCCQPSPLYFVIQKRSCPPSSMIWNRSVPHEWHWQDLKMFAWEPYIYMSCFQFMDLWSIDAYSGWYKLNPLCLRSFVGDYYHPSMGHGPCNTSGWSVHAIPFFGLNGCCQRWALNVKGNNTSGTSFDDHTAGHGQ